MSIPQPDPQVNPRAQHDLLAAAFRDLHGARLHGFALLVSLGDRQRAAAVSADALAAGARRAGELRHPERAAAWLRARTWRRLRGSTSRLRPGTGRERNEALRGLGMQPAALAGLGALSLQERTALVAGSIERLESADLQLVLGTDAAGARKLLTRARTRYLAAVLATSEQRPPSEDVPGSGDLAALVDGIASRTIGDHGALR
jgi:hypothetical protein